MEFIFLLQKWYQQNKHCSFELGNVDNPGWRLKVNGEKNKSNFSVHYIDEGTPLVHIDEITPLVNNDNWIVINTNETAFDACCGRINFPDLVCYLVEWLNFEKISLDFRNGFLHFLQKWFFIKFAIQSLEYRGESWAIDLAWKHHGYGMILKTLDNGGWYLEVEDEFDKSELKISISDEINNDWLIIEANSENFKGTSSNNRLPELIDYFMKWENI
ncbi:MAG: hypothetical protein IJM09_07315 [Neisseriaceae bacterium]|nr:hypothetical protein [Neisseriaceae bacterium]